MLLRSSLQLFQWLNEYLLTCTGTWPRGCEIRMLYDGDCSLCMKEVNFLRKRDAAVGKIDFVDIAAPTYKAEDSAGITFQQVGRHCTRGCVVLMPPYGPCTHSAATANIVHAHCWHAYNAAVLLQPASIITCSD
eukprot:GHUV01039107.1.p1 GENE.GHUV01039107.1~~GHUV01039107.1.p1  ORF type:complete len:134 (-),score=24.48 GHUV01039107.1:295-696(-)